MAFEEHITSARCFRSPNLTGSIMESISSVYSCLEMEGDGRWADPRREPREDESTFCLRTGSQELEPPLTLPLRCKKEERNKALLLSCA